MSGQATGQVGPEPLLTKAELADEFSVTPKTIQRWIAQGAPHMRVGRVVRLRRSEVEKWATKQEAA